MSSQKVVANALETTMMVQIIEIIRTLQIFSVRVFKLARPIST